MASPSLSMLNVSNGHGYLHNLAAAPERCCVDATSRHAVVDSRSLTAAGSARACCAERPSQRISRPFRQVERYVARCSPRQIMSLTGLPDLSRGMRQVAARLVGSWQRRAPAAASAVAEAGKPAAVVGEKTIEDWNASARAARLEHLEEQALSALRKCAESFERPTFPCALIAGDVVLLHLLDRLGLLSSGRVKVVFVDTFHLFPETHEFLALCEEKYGFKAESFHAKDFADRDAYVEVHGSDLFIVDIDEYDRICKVEPFGRALKTLEVDCMVNGRRRDHGADRSQLELFEAGGMVKAQPLAYWEFRDCWDYIKKYDVPYHPLHDDGYPSIGDIFSTLPVPKDKWFEYGGERTGRFQGLRNKDGSDKTECGIHVGDAREVTANGMSSSLVNPASSSSLLPPPPSSTLNRPT